MDSGSGPGQVTIVQLVPGSQHSWAGRHFRHGTPVQLCPPQPCGGGGDTLCDLVHVAGFVGAGVGPLGGGALPESQGRGPKSPRVPAEAISPTLATTLGGMHSKADPGLTESMFKPRSSDSESMALTTAQHCMVQSFPYHSKH